MCVRTRVCVCVPRQSINVVNVCLCVPYMCVCISQSVSASESVPRPYWHAAACVVMNENVYSSACVSEVCQRDREHHRVTVYFHVCTATVMKNRVQNWLVDGRFIIWTKQNNEHIVLCSPYDCKAFLFLTSCVPWFVSLNQWMLAGISVSSILCIVDDSVGTKRVCT